MKLVSATAALSLVLVTGHCPAYAQAQTDAPEAAGRGVAGVWVLTMLSHQMGLELEQDGTTVTGALLVQGRRVDVHGTFADHRLELDGDGRIGDGQGGEPVPLRLSARLKEDGTLEGTVKTARGLSEWTGERLRGQ